MTTPARGTLKRVLLPSWVREPPAAWHDGGMALSKKLLSRDEEAAERLAVRLVLPLGACHLPAFVILGIAPVVASVGMSMLSG